MQWLAEDERTNSVEEIVYFSNFDLEGARLCLKLHFFFRDSNLPQHLCIFIAQLLDCDK